MITVFGEGRGFRVVWLLEEMGLPYRLRPVDQEQQGSLSVRRRMPTLARTGGRAAYTRAMETCQAVKAWLARGSGV